LPYGLDPVTLETKGKETLGGVLKESRCLAAHFRYDPFTDRLVTFSFQLAMSGSCKLFIYEFDRQWQLLSKQTHSFENYYYCTPPQRSHHFARSPVFL
jgi:all-trans-8'-apo-beta-carotenal 15,15'-oxygenase